VGKISSSLARHAELVGLILGCMQKVMNFYFDIGIGLKKMLIIHPLISLVNLSWLIISCDLLATPDYDILIIIS